MDCVPCGWGNITEHMPLTRPHFLSCLSCRAQRDHMASRLSRPTWRGTLSRQTLLPLRFRASATAAAKRACGAAHHACDVLLVDGTNLLCTAQSSAWAAGWDQSFAASGSGHQAPMWQLHAASFHAWLQFLLLAASPANAAIMVLDSKDNAPEADNGRHSAESASSVRQQHIPSYLRKRRAKKDKRSTSQGKQFMHTSWYHPY